MTFARLLEKLFRVNSFGRYSESTFTVEGYNSRIKTLFGKIQEKKKILFKITAYDGDIPEIQ